MKPKALPFKNSDTCEGVSLADSNAPVDMAIINISGRYPQSGWAVNHKTHEMVFIQEGSGSLQLKMAEDVQLNRGDVVSVKAGERFAWNGNMTLLMACSPPFDPSQYGHEEDI